MRTKQLIASIVILYNPSDQIISKWKDLSSSSKSVIFIFVDNTPIESLSSRNKELDNYIPLLSNQGIAKAQNVGIEKAKEQGCRYIIFFDQDSNPSLELISSLKETFILLSSKFKMAAVGPRIIDSASVVDIKQKDTMYEKVDSIISSGTFTSIDVLKDVGGMDDSLFIDLVDHEWCWRVTSKGYSIFKNNSIYLEHKVGITNVKICGVHIHITVPIRYFYTYRNARLLLFRSYVPLYWKKYALYHYPAQLLLMPFCPVKKWPRWSSIKYAIKGLFSNKI